MMKCCLSLRYYRWYWYDIHVKHCIYLDLSSGNEYVHGYTEYSSLCTNGSKPQYTAIIDNVFVVAYENIPFCTNFCHLLLLSI